MLKNVPGKTALKMDLKKKPNEENVSNALVLNVMFSFVYFVFSFLLGYFFLSGFNFIMGFLSFINFKVTFRWFSAFDGFLDVVFVVIFFLSNKAFPFFFPRSLFPVPVGIFAVLAACSCRNPNGKARQTPRLIYGNGIEFSV